MIQVGKGVSNRRMTEIVRDLRDGDALFHKVIAETVPESMKVKSLVDPRLLLEPLEHMPNIGLVNRFAFQSAEDRCTFGDGKLFPPIQPILKYGQGSGIDPNQATLVPFPVSNLDVLLGEADVSESKVQAFLEP